MSDPIPSGEEMVLTDFLSRYTEAELRGELRKRREAEKQRGPVGKVLTAPFRALRWCWRGITLTGAKKFGYLCAGIFVALSVVTVFSNRGVLAELQKSNVEREATTKTNSQILRVILSTSKKIDEATSQEAADKQTQVLELLVKEIRCNNQEDVQRLADELRKLDIPPDGTITLITTECQRQISGN